MKGAAAHAAKLRRLLAEGALPHSACGTAFLALLQPLRHAGVLSDERAPGGRRLVVCDAETLQDFVQRTFPDIPTAEGEMTRTLGIARFRDSKALASDTPEIVLIRAWRASALASAGLLCDAAASTERHGVFAFLLRADSTYLLDGPCALVENPAVFTSIERLHLGVGFAIHGHGCISQRVLDWLSTQTAADFTLLHLPDYDPAGMEEFERLRVRLGTRVQLHLPADLESRFARFSNRALLESERTQATLARLRRSTAAEIQRVVSLIDRFNAGLEQEALLLEL